ncbi:hypothetical protein K9K85_02830 [Patescibacteria group bacterium]|nr:hypothetical protein [Patescibacteria group bacterium]
MFALLNIVKSFFFETLLSIFYFPIWWYTKGLKKRFLFFKERIKALSNALALKIMFTNYFKPMFGDYSRQGRMISFFMRTVLLLWRIFLFLIGFLSLLLLFLGLTLLPIIATWQIVIRLI